ncbi:hypothetical protein [uncultured Mycobacterium sp.]|uniref:hypothetical protein n=1 Tax=uncultured Mycobacterium sp. TaxID=171292 RepID=UPI0035CADBA1
MLRFTLDPWRWWPVRWFTRNPLVRKSDRVEALVIMFAIMASLGAAPVAGAVGSAVYAAGHQLYAHEALTRHPGTESAVGSNRTERVDPGTAVPVDQAKADQTSKVWIDNDGKQVAPPTPTSVAATEGIIAAAATLLAVVIPVATFALCVHSRLRRIRYAEWERELRCLVSDDGGRNNRSYG